MVVLTWPHRLAWSRTSDFHSGNRGSNPLGVNMNEALAQSVEHLTFNERVDGSSPSSLITFHSARARPASIAVRASHQEAHGEDFF